MKSFSRFFLPAAWLLLLLLLSVVTTAEAGSITKQGASLYLDGKVLIKFDQLLLAWNGDKNIDRIKYDISCAKGKAVLNNVLYLDRATDPGKDVVRWSLAPFALNKDISNKPHHAISFIRTTKVNIGPYDLKTAKVQFKFHASGRDYSVTWIPRTGELFGTW